MNTQEATNEQRSLFFAITGNRWIPTINDVKSFLDRNGFLEDDPRWTECIELLYSHDKINEIIFLEIFKERITEIRKAIDKELSITDFQSYTKVLDEIYEKVKKCNSGEVTKLIPQLAKKSPELFGYAVCTINGQRYFGGDCEENFCVQACANPITYGIALETCGPEVVHKIVDKEPSGQSFNSLSFTDKDIPYNPLINSGAIALCSLIEKDSDPSTKFECVLKWWRRLAGGFKPGFDNSVYLSERQSADKNYAIAHLMRAKKIFDEKTNLVDILEFYFQCCSIEMDCKRMAIVAATLANGGICPLTNERIFGLKTTRSILSLMFSCGMYEETGQFAFSVGLPAKSGIAGCTMIVVPGICGYCVYSPKLNNYGNSTRALEFSKELVKRFDYHQFDLTDRVDVLKKRSEKTVQFFYACFENDIMTVRKMIRYGMDVNMKDYDDRTPLHIACSNGNYEIVKILLAHNANPMIKDRWRQCALENAIQGGYFEIENLIIKSQERNK
jgi:glutaminase